MRAVGAIVLALAVAVAPTFSAEHVRHRRQHRHAAKGYPGQAGARPTPSPSSIAEPPSSTTEPASPTVQRAVEGLGKLRLHPGRDYIDGAEGPRAPKTPSRN